MSLGDPTAHALRATVANQYRLKLFLRVTLHPPSLVGEKEDKDDTAQTQRFFTERDIDTTGINDC